MPDSLDIRVVVFDFDGTLVDSAPIKTEAFTELYRPYGDEVAEEVRRRHLAAEGVSRFVKFREWHEELLGLSITDDDADRLSAKFDQLVEARIIDAPEIAGAHGALVALSEKLPMYVASATPEAPLRRIVVARGMSGFFAGVRGTPTTKTSVLKDVAKAHRCDRPQVLMVGDAESDRQAAQLAGASFVGVVPGERGDDRVGNARSVSSHPWTAPGSAIVTVSDLSTLTTLLL